MIQVNYTAKVKFEISIDTNGSNYLVIYGKHINGYFCCIPNWKVSCEMSEPEDVFYNANNLIDAGISEAAAKEIAKDICTYQSSEKKYVEEVLICKECIYKDKGSPDGDCIYAGLCCYGTSEEKTEEQIKESKEGKQA